MSTTFSMPGQHYQAAAPSASRWPWLTAIFLFLVFAGATFNFDVGKRWYETEYSDVDALVGRISEGQFTRQLSFAVLGLWALWGIFQPAERPSRAKIYIAYPIIVFIAWAFLSAGWSVDMQQTIKRLIVFGAVVLSVLVIVRKYNILEIAQIAFLISLITACFGSCVEAGVLLTDLGNFGKWRFGGLMHPNHGGLNAAVLMLSSLYLFWQTKNKLFVLTLIFGTLILLATKSRTALMSTITAVVIFLLLATSASRAMGLLLLSAWAIAGVMWLSSMDMLPDLNQIATMGRDDIKKADIKQLTGRTDIWRFAIMQGSKDPNRTAVGYGYETFWTPENARGVSEFVKFRISEGHCVYLDWYLELGLVGAGLYVFVLLGSLIRWAYAARKLHSPSAAIAAAILAGAVVHGFAESSTGDANMPTFFLFASIACAARLRPDEEEETV